MRERDGEVKEERERLTKAKERGVKGGVGDGDGDGTGGGTERRP